MVSISYQRNLEQLKLAYWHLLLSCWSKYYVKWSESGTTDSEWSILWVCIVDGVIMVAKGAWFSVYHLFNLISITIEVLSIYAKSGSKNGKHGQSLPLLTYPFNLFNTCFATNFVLLISHFALLQSNSFLLTLTSTPTLSQQLYIFWKLITKASSLRQNIPSAIKVMQGKKIISKDEVSRNLK